MSARSNLLIRIRSLQAECDRLLELHAGPGGDIASAQKLLADVQQFRRELAGGTRLVGLRVERSGAQRLQLPSDLAAAWTQAGRIELAATQLVRRLS